MNSAAAAIDRKMEAALIAGSPLLCWFEDCGKNSVPLVGGKCASLGELINAGVRVPPGFALTTEGCRHFIDETGIDRELKSLLGNLDCQDMEALERDQFDDPEDHRGSVLLHRNGGFGCRAYRKLSVRCGIPAVPVAVRSSATAEDLPGASFAGQQDTFLWIREIDEVLQHVRRCISSLYTGRAIAYRTDRGYVDESLAISVGVQKMANSYTAGVMFTIHPGNGDRSVIVINSNYGFGKSVVSGEVTPDQFVVNKVTLDIIDRTISQEGALLHGRSHLHRNPTPSRCRSSDRKYSR